MTNWFEGDASLLRGRTDPIATISGECMVELAQPVILANLAAQPGVSASYWRFRYHIEQALDTGGAISLKVELSGVDLTSTGDMSYGHDDIEILIINSKTGKHTDIGRGSGGSSGRPGRLTINRDLSIDDGLPGPDLQSTDPPIFLKDTRLYFIGRRHGGTAAPSACRLKSRMSC
jgi:hypothetical protein